MIINLKNGTNDDTVCASLRMNRQEYLELRRWMHTAAQADRVSFPINGHMVAYVIKRGYGWYHIAANNETRACDKVRYAITVLHRFMAEQAKAKAAHDRIVAPTIGTDLRVVAFSAAHSTGEFSYLGNAQPKAPPLPPPPAAASRLNALAALYNNRRH